MPLINCPECSKELSDKAINCPNCGFPLNTEDKINLHPDLPKDLSIGKKIKSWLGDKRFEGTYSSTENNFLDIKAGKVTIILHQNGISISNGGFLGSAYEIHYLQISNVLSTSMDELYESKKSGLGRAVVGGVLLGGVGAIIGGMSGSRKKVKVKNKYFLAIEFFDIKRNKDQTLLISGNKLTTNGFALMMKESMKETAN